MSWHAVKPTIGWAKQQFERKLHNGVRLIVHGGGNQWHVHARNVGRHIVWMAKEANFTTADTAQAAAERWASEAVAAGCDTAHRPRSPRLRQWMTRWEGDRRETPPHDLPIKATVKKKTT